VAVHLPTIRFLIMNAWAVGGTIRTTFTMAEELAKRGHAVEIVSVYKLRRIDPALPVPDGVRLRTLTDLREPTLERYVAGRTPVDRLRHKLVSEPSRLISYNDWRYDNFSLLTDVALCRFLASVRDGILIGTRPGLNLAIARLVPRQVVRIGQDHVNLSSYRAELRKEMKIAYPRLDMVTALTPETARRYRKMLDRTVPVKCFPNAVPDVGGRRADPDAKVVVAAGRLTSQKGFDRLLPAWRDVSAQHPDWQLRIFGDGRDREVLERQTSELGIGATVKLAGFSMRLHEEFSRASMYVLSSREEGFPMVLIEAMGMGLAPVSVDCKTGPRDIITDGVDGYLVPQDDRPALAAAMSDLMADAQKRRAFGEAARRVSERFDPGALAERWERTLARLVAAKDGKHESFAGRLLSHVGVRVAAKARRTVGR
jgi:glycosyltransferase involved in cell wall biosynthesis